MPVPPPTFPSATGPPRALSSAAHASCLVTWKPLMSLRPPSHVSATTGSDHSSWRRRSWRTYHSITASRTTPTEWVLVIATGPHRNPDSSTQVVPVISPLPFIVNHAANTGSAESLDRKSTRLNSSHSQISYAVFCLKKKNTATHWDLAARVVSADLLDRPPPPSERSLPRES